MQSDFFDKKIREAADHHHPAYHEDAWKKMKKLLDQHMPEEDDRRKRYFFLIPLFLLLGGGIWLITSQPWKTKNATTAASENVKGVPISTTESSGISGTSGEPTGTGSATDESNTNPAPVENANILPGNENRQEPQVNNSAARNLKRSDTRKPVIAKVSRILAGKEVKDEEEKLPGNDPAPVTSLNPVQPGQPPIPVPEKEKVKEESKTATVEKKPEATEKTTPETVQKKPGKKPMSFASRLLFFGSTGPDISFTRTSEMGKTRMLLGAGLGFRLNDRLTVRSGFFSARKLYSAKPSDYDPPPQFWNYYPNMQKIDADCKVYEVPLLLSYRFGKGSTQSWFATTGVSSYFMKKEEYTYYYKPTPTGDTYKRVHTINNRFEHHFSVITLSAGYQKNLGKRVTIMAEPYFKLPVTGIGFGKVRLNSGGVMFSIGVKPFGK